MGEACFERWQALKHPLPTRRLYVGSLLLAETHIKKVFGQVELVFVSRLGRLESMDFSFFAIMNLVQVFGILVCFGDSIVDTSTYVNEW